MKTPEKKLKMVHLQLTRNCNLRCYFCGQWGKKGFFAAGGDNGLVLSEWMKVIDSIRNYCETSSDLPVVTLWGGEPLIYPGFEDIVNYLRKYGFELSLVTNGVLLDKYPDLIKSEFSTVYVSIDGPEAIHDSIRGKGVFAKAVNNIKKLKSGKTTIVFMTTICPQNIEVLPKLPYLFESCGADKILLHELIYLNSHEIAVYKSWLCSRFGIDAKTIESWRMELPPDYESRKQAKLDELFRHLIISPTETQVEYLPHGSIVKEDFCLSPFRHLHVTWNGEVLFCTDFYDLSVGNVRNADLIDIWNGELAERFRREIMQGNCPTCNHCAWKGNRDYALDTLESFSLIEP